VFNSDTFSIITKAINAQATSLRINHGRGASGVFNFNLIAFHSINQLSINLQICLNQIFHLNRIRQIVISLINRTCLSA